MRKSIYEYVLAATNRALEESGITNFNAEQKNRFDQVIINELDRVTVVGGSGVLNLMPQNATLRTVYFDDQLEPVDRKKVIKEFSEAVKDFANANKITRGELHLEDTPRTTNLVMGELKDFENITLFNFIKRRAVHKVHGQCDFAILLPNIHGLIKLLMNGQTDEGLRFKLFAAIQGYAYWEAYVDYVKVRYDSRNNYWFFDNGGLSHIATDLANIVKLILEEVKEQN